MWSKQSAVVTLLLTKVRPEEATVLLEGAALPTTTAACCEQIVWLPQREVVSVQQKDLVKAGGVGQHKGLELKGEAFQVEREMVPGVSNLPGIYAGHIL